MSTLRVYARGVFPWLGILGIGLSVTGAWAGDEDLKKGKEPPRYPNYTYEEEVPRHTITVPGASAGVFFERHQYGEGLLGRWRSDYLNYGWKNYESYRLNTTPHLRNYDVFGNFITSGYEIFTLEEFRTRSPETGSLLHKGRFYQNWLRHMVVADEVYSGWSTRLMAGDFIHTTFTPLTLDMANLNGLRFDAVSATDKEFTLLISRVSDPIKLDRGADLPSGGVFGAQNEGAYLLGGHWEMGGGQAFTLGATYVNLYRFDSLRGFRKNSRKGLAPRNTVPQRIVVRFEDDSPEDQRGGAAVFDIAAQVRLAPPVDVPGEEEQVVEIRPLAIETSPGVVERGRHLEANGLFRDGSGGEMPVYIDYEFEVPPNAVEVKFYAAVANDYKISVRQKHFFVTDPLRGSGEKRETEFFIIRRAENNIIDLSNKELIRFDYGLATGVEVLGLNGKLSIPGIEVHGEVARSNNYYQYPALLGRRSRFDDVAGYLTVTKDWSLFSVGAEGFSIGPKYTSYNPHPSAPRDPQRPLGEVFYFNEERQSPYRNQGTFTNNLFYALVDDNDDMLYGETPDNWLLQGTPVETRFGATGIFPFFDLDQDGHQDTNRNRNEFADYDEPFLMYSADPPEFYYGDDFNHNAIIDAWEDDDLSNYPYYKDEEGLHLTAGFEPFQDLKLTLGRYDIGQLAGAGQNQVLYGRLTLDRRYSSQWRVRLDHETQDVQDDIPNDYFFYSLREGIRDGGGQPSYAQGFFADRLEARDSFVNRGLLRIGYQPAKAWNIEGKLRYELNHQRARLFGDGGSQSEDDINFYGAVLKTDYTCRWGELNLNPRFKVLYRSRDRQSQEEATLKNLQILPILRADYHLTERSQLRLGVQGFPGLVDHRRDFLDEANDSARMSWTLMWFNEADYEGYRIGTEVGVMQQRIDFDEPDQQDTKFTRFFIRMLSGVGAVVR